MKHDNYSYTYFTEHLERVTQVLTSKVYGTFTMYTPSGKKEMVTIWNTRLGRMTRIPMDKVVSIID